MRRTATRVYLFIIALTFLYALTLNATAQNPPKIYIAPRITSASPTATFSINASIVQAKDVYSWDIFISWNPSLLNVSSVSQGSFLKGPYGNYSTWYTYRKNETEGWLYVICTLLGEPAEHAVSGNGTLAKITFLVERTGECALDLYDSHLYHHGVPYPYEMSHNREGGYFNNKPGAQVYEIDYNEDNIIEFYGSTISNSTIGAVYFKPMDRSINFTVTGSSGTNGYCNISIPRKMLDCHASIEDWKIFLATTDISSSCIKTRDSYYTYIYIPYSHSTQTITVRGTWDLVVGETIKHHIIWDSYEFDVYTTSNSTVTTVYFDQPNMRINFTVTGPSGTAGLCNVTIPKSMLNCLEGPEYWQIIIDSTDISSSCTITANLTHTFIYIPYTHSTHTIKVKGTWVVPEFPATTISSLLIMAISGVAIGIILKKKGSSKRH